MLILLAAAAATLASRESAGSPADLARRHQRDRGDNGSETRVLDPGTVAIDGRDIVAVDTPDAIARVFEAESIDAAGQVVMPGLVNTHTHAPMVLYRGLADDLALMDWLQK